MNDIQACSIELSIDQTASWPEAIPYIGWQQEVGWLSDLEANLFGQQIWGEKSDDTLWRRDILT